MVHLLVFLLLAADPFVESEDFGKWFDARVKATEREIIRVPLVSHLPWGCECPDRYFGLNDMSYSGKAWIAVEGLMEHSLLEPGHLVLAEGAAPRRDAGRSAGLSVWMRSIRQCSFPVSSCR